MSDKQSRSNRQGCRFGGASYTKSGGRFGACPAELYLIEGRIFRPLDYCAADRYIKIYLWSAVIPSMHTGGISNMTFLRLRVPGAWSVCVLSVRSIVAVILMCIILYISRGSLEVRLHFSPLRRRFEWLEIKRTPQFRATLNGVMICDSMNDLFTVNDKTASSWR